MERAEAEARIAGLLREIRDVVEEYGGTSGHMALAMRPGYISFNNRYWPGGGDEGRPLNFFEFYGEDQ